MYFYVSGQRFPCLFKENNRKVERNFSCTNRFPLEMRIVLLTSARWRCQTLQKYPVCPVWRVFQSWGIVKTKIIDVSYDILLKAIFIIGILSHSVFTKINYRVSLVNICCLCFWLFYLHRTAQNSWNHHSFPNNCNWFYICPTSKRLSRLLLGVGDRKLNIKLGWYHLVTLKI